MISLVGDIIYIVNCELFPSDQIGNTNMMHFCASQHSILKNVRFANAA